MDITHGYHGGKNVSRLSTIWATRDRFVGITLNYAGSVGLHGPSSLYCLILAFDTAVRTQTPHYVFVTHPFGAHPTCVLARCASRMWHPLQIHMMVWKCTSVHLHVRKPTVTCTSDILTCMHVRHVKVCAYLSQARMTKLLNHTIYVVFGLVMQTPPRSSNRVHT